MSRCREYAEDNLHSFYNNLLEPAIGNLSLSDYDRDRLWPVVYDEIPNRRLMMTNEAVRRLTTRAFAQAMVEYFRAIAGDDGLRFFFLTAAWDDGFVPMLNPTCDLAKLKQKIRDLLYHARLSGVCALEANPMRQRYFGEACRRVFFHIHGIVWTRDPLFDHHDLQERTRSRFPNMLGAPGLELTTRADYVRLQRRRGFDVPEPTADMTAEDIAYLVAYMLKAPNGVKRIIQDPDDPTKERLKTSVADCNGKLALQMTQIWSYLTAFDTIFAVGEGKVPRAAASQQLRDWDQNNRLLNTRALDVDLDLFWRDVQRANPQAGLSNCSLIV
jgi:hypothetical protein